MRPLQLTIEGLASFRNQQEIDFKALDLFVIVGPTGAGKTTVLDAIALGLYGKIPRTGGQNAGEFVTHGESRAKVQLEFRSDGETYRVSRVLPRNGAQKAILERLAGDVWLSEVVESGVRPVNARIEAVVGLDFEAFTRAVLLPQGEFARFLAGDAQERREILVRLLDLGRYEQAGQLAREEADGLRAKVESSEVLIAHEYADADDEAVAVAAKGEKAAAARARAVTRSGEEVERLTNALLDLQQQLGEMAKDADALARTDQALTAIATSWLGLAPLAAQASDDLREAKVTLDEALERRKLAEVRLEEVHRETGGEAELTALEQARAARVRETVTLGELAAAIAAAEGVIGELNGKCAAAGIELEEAEGREKAARVAEEEVRRKAEQAVRSVQRASERAEAENVAAELRAADLKWQSELKARQAVLTHVEGAIRHAEELLKHLESAHVTIGIRTGLAIGEPCPVCLQSVQSIPADQPDVAAAIEAARESVRTAGRDLSQAQRQVAEAESELRATARRIEETKETLARLADCLPLDQAEAEAEALRRKCDAASVERAAAADRVRHATSSHGEVATSLAGAKADRDSRVRELAGCKVRLSEAEATLIAGFPEGIPEDVNGALGARRSAYEAARSDEATARKAHDAARDAQEQAVANRQHLERQAAALRERCAEQRGVLGQVSATRGFAALAGVVAGDAVGDEVTALDAWREAMAAEIDRLRDSARGNKDDAVAALIRELAAMGLPEAPADANEARAVSQAAVRAASQEALRAADHARNLERRLESRRTLETEVATARKREQLYRALADELRRNRFIDFLLGESIGQLASLASAELQGISGGRYSLNAAKSGFLVVDHANADETRSVDTLSGGETFLASLSLAMALARSMTDIAGQAVGSRLEAMFIDEGFGTLDWETLDAVIDALERLRDSERLVGVITHVSQLAERIPDGFAIERAGTGSRVRTR